jgi:hypothetical protein
MESVQARVLLRIFVTSLFFTGRSCLPHAQLPSWRTTPCLLSVTAYQCIRSYPPYLEGISSISNLRAPHAMLTRDPTNMDWNTEVGNRFGFRDVVFCHLRCNSVFRTLFSKFRSHEAKALLNFFPLLKT